MKAGQKPLPNNLEGAIAVMWVFVASHCSIGAISGLEFLRRDEDGHAPKDDHRSCEETG